MAQAPKRASIEINGETLKIKAGSAKIQVGGLSGTPVVADDGTVDTSYEPKPCMIECVVIMTPGNNFETTLRNLLDGTGTFTWIGGASYALTNLSANEAGDWSWDGEGLACKFHANAAQPAS